MFFQLILHPQGNIASSRGGGHVHRGAGKFCVGDRAFIQLRHGQTVNFRNHTVGNRRCCLYIIVTGKSQLRKLGKAGNTLDQISLFQSHHRIRTVRKTRAGIGAPRGTGTDQISPVIKHHHCGLVDTCKRVDGDLPILQQGELPAAAAIAVQRDDSGLLHGRSTTGVPYGNGKDVSLAYSIFVKHQVRKLGCKLGDRSSVPLGHGEFQIGKGGQSGGARRFTLSRCRLKIYGELHPAVRQLPQLERF